MRRTLRIGILTLAILAAFPFGAAAEFAGVDANGDTLCGPEDALFEATAGDVGTNRSLKLFFSELPGDVGGYGCTWCVSDSSKIGTTSFTFTPFPSWSFFGPYDTQSGPFPQEISQPIQDQYPKFRCWSISGQDFTFANPATGDPVVLGTFQYQVAEEGCIQWLIDGPNCAGQTTQFSSFFFDGPGEVCDTVPCPSVGEPLAIDDAAPACPVADAIKNVPYPAGTIFTATGGTSPYTWSATGLPTGMTIGASTGELGGTPTVRGGFPFTVIADDAADGHDERACSLFVRDYGVTVVLVSADTTITPESDTVVHSFQVTNTGNVGDTYDLSSWAWDFATEIFGTGNPVFLPAGNSASVQLRHIVPDVACPLTGIHAYDRAFLAAASQTSAAVKDTAFADIAVAFEAGVDVADFPNGICGTPGGIKNVDFSVENLGACPDTFDLQPHVSHIDWSVVLPGGLFLVLGPGASQNVTVEVGIPADALCTDVEIVSLTATGRRYEATDSDSVNECVNAVLDGTLTDENNQVGAPGDIMAYCFTITNTGNCLTHYELDFTRVWAFDYPGTTFNLDPGDTASFCVDHEIPSDAADGDFDQLCAILLASDVITKDANQIGTPVDTSCVTTTAGIPCESTVDVVHTGSVGCSYPGLTVQDTFTVQNTGDCADLFDLTADVDLAGWLAEIVGSHSIALDPQQTATVYVDVTIPAPALCTDLAELTLVADGQTYGATDSDAGSICVYPVQDGTLSDESDQNGNPYDTIWYHFTITNTGNCPTSFFASFASLWPTTTAGEAEVLDPGDTAIVAVGHVIPGAAEDGDKDTLCAFLTTFFEGKNGAYLDTSCVVTTAIAPCVAGVDVTGDTYLSGGPGDTLYADFAVQNLGSAPDRFLLATSSDLGWPVQIVGSDTTGIVDPNAFDNVEVRVIIPAGTACGTLDRVSLTAFSFCDPYYYDTHWVEIGVDPVCAVSVSAYTEDSTGAPGQTMRYYFDIANEGNCDFQYEILVYQSPNWDTAYAITSPVQIPDGGEVTVWVDVTIPGGAQPGDEHTLTVCGSCYYDDPRFGVAKRAEIACDSTITRVPTGCEADQPILSLGGYETVSYGGPTGLWQVQVSLKNNGPGKAESITAQMNEDLAWLLISDGICSYPDLTPGASSLGYDSYTFDLQNYPGGSFNVWFDVTYTDSCGNPYQVRLDPTFRDPAEGGVPVPASRFALHQNVPNPFNPETSITFELSSGGYSELMIYNAAGQLVKTLWQGSLPTGHHTFLWNGESDRGTSVPSGSYFYSLRNGGLTETRRMVLVR